MSAIERLKAFTARNEGVYYATYDNRMPALVADVRLLLWSVEEAETRCGEAAAVVTSLLAQHGRAMDEIRLNNETLVLARERMHAAGEEIAKLNESVATAGEQLSAHTKAVAVIQAKLDSLAMDYRQSSIGATLGLSFALKALGQAPFEQSGLGSL